MRLIVSMVLFFVVFIILVPENYILAAEIIGILLLHEFGHLIMMKIFGYKALNMLFIPLLGAMVTGNKIKVSQKQKVLISMMGPLPGIILGCGLFAWAVAAAPDIYLVELALLLMSINILNLIPLDPLDGGNIIESLFFPSNDRVKMYFTLFSSVIIIATGVYFSFFPILIFGFLMAFKVRAYQKNKVIHDDLDGLELNYKKEYSDLSDQEYWTMRRVFLENNPKIKEIIPEDGTIWENEKLIVEQINQLLRYEIKKDMSLFQRLFYLAVLLAAIFVPIMLVLSNNKTLEWYFNHAGF
ncbi:MAG: site-2 protease family protein [Bacteroidetes bacterium]|nr:site-2 protease family protein [Bacteroidota bacterium]